MIGEILNEVYGRSDPQVLSELIGIPIVASSLFRSFDEFTQSMIFRMITQGGKVEHRQIVGMMHPNLQQQGAAKLEKTMHDLERLKIVTRKNFANPEYNLNRHFEVKFNEYLENPFSAKGEELSDDQYDEQFFNLLGLLRESNDILKECKIGNMGEGRISKDNFDFIRMEVGAKVSMLVKGFLRHKLNHSRNSKIIKDVICLSLMPRNRRYRMNQRNQEVIRELERIRLVRRLGPDSFTINRFLYHFAHMKNPHEAKLLNCSIIIETNFKVYVQIPPNRDQQNYKLVRDIVSKLVEIEHQEYNFQELMVGSITRDRVGQLIESDIRVEEYLSFFRQYMVGDLSVERELGRWNKIRYLGLEGPSEEKAIPNNVRQELKLWQSVRDRGMGLMDDVNLDSDYEEGLSQ